ncbi:MAG: prepilin-type N-terminal cleavage/methylation domain-containing protein [Campylobacterota bacterium]|nr:prepilin-type N-terminal cleavage/methylation domain-containing protein [Campylobacterota bacterium]
MNQKQFGKERGASEGFTLIEVMVAIVIITVVIAALLQLFSNNTKLLGTVKEKVELSTQGSILLGVGNVGFEKKQIRLDGLLREFKLDDALRRKLKTIKADVSYKEVMRLDSIDFQEESERLAEMEGVSALKKRAETASLEVGRTTLEINGVHTSFLRLRLQ